MDSLKKPAVRRSQLFASKDLDDQWYSKWTDYIIIYDEKDVFGTGRTFFFSTQTSMVYEGPFDPSVARQSKQRHQLLSLRLYRTGKVREACVFSRADHDISEEALHCVCRALEADLLKLMHDGVDPSIAYMRLCNSSSDTPKNIHRSEILTSRKMAAWTHPLAPMLVVRLDAQLDLEGLPEQSRALLRPSDGDHTSNSGQDVAVARSQQAPGMQARAASAGGTKPLASQRTAEHVEMVDLDSDKVEGDTATDDQDTPSELPTHEIDFGYEDPKCSLDCTCNSNTMRELMEQSAPKHHKLMVFIERKMDQVQLEVYDDMEKLEVDKLRKDVEQLRKDVRALKKNGTELKNTVDSIHGEVHALLDMVSEVASHMVLEG